MSISRPRPLNPRTHIKSFMCFRSFLTVKSDEYPNRVNRMEFGHILCGICYTVCYISMFYEYIVWRSVMINGISFRLRLYALFDLLQARTSLYHVYVNVSRVKRVPSIWKCWYITAHSGMMKWIWGNYDFLIHANVFDDLDDSYLSEILWMWM